MLLIVNSSKSLLQKGEQVQEIKALILDRGNRKFWYIKYQVIFENNDVKAVEASTKVLKTEKTLKYMQSHYLPAWISQKKDELKVKQVESKEFGFYAEIFLKSYEKFHDYLNVKYKLNRILKDFRKLDITQIKKLKIRQWINDLRNSQTSQEVSKNSKLKYLRIFRGVFEQAVDDNLIDRNFTLDIKIEGEANRGLNSVKPFSKVEVAILLQNSLDTKYGALLHPYLGIAFNQGMSPSEIVGLQVGDIDLKNQTITIKRNITKGKLKETKNSLS